MFWKWAKFIEWKLNTELNIEEKEIGRSYFKRKTEKAIDVAITPNRPDCLGIRGIARDLSSTGIGKLMS